MARGIRRLGALVVATAAAACAGSCKGGCEDGAEGVGNPCLPSLEQDPGFSGFGTREVSVERGAPGCPTGVCLVNHFQGRVSCPYGQSAEDVQSDPACFVPGDRAEAVAVPVSPQLEGRRPDDAVYCSCRCAGPDGSRDGDYCECPSEFECAPVVEDWGGESSAIAGSYCIPKGTRYDVATNPSTCDAITASCGPPAPFDDGEAPSSRGVTTTVFGTPWTSTAVTSVDLLLVIDNSISMADKQALFAEAAERLIVSLVAPPCVDDEGSAAPSVDGVCPEGTSPAHEPVRDLHVGVVSSSLGGHGGIACSPDEGSTFVPEKDERGELIAPLRGLETPDELGFFAWDGDGDPGELAADVAELVRATGETGCGYEAPLEAFYRFLVDPTPPVQVLNDGAVSYVDGINATLLEQRARFLRPDSLVAVLILSDENDCSVRDDGPGFYMAGVTAGGKVPRGTQICATDPNSRCCRSCALAESSPPDGCSPLSADPSCQLGPFTGAEEHANLRCYEQKRRFGIDFLYPTERYVDALTNAQVYGRPCGADGDCPPSPQQPEGGQCADVGGGARYCEYTNPLFSGNAYFPDLAPRYDSQHVFLAGIVGVPWQDLATPETLEDPTALTLLSALSLHGDASLADRWDTILGSATADGYPLDPFMWESVTPRVGTHAVSGLPLPEANPVTGDRPLDPASAGAASPINGHEYDVTDGGDLQYACVFPLPAARNCTEDVVGACDCKAEDSNLATKPLCQDAGQAEAGTTQYYAKAYPGLRFLSVLEAFGTNSIVGSVCPKITTGDPDALGYGYNPAAAAVEQRLAGALQPPCLPRSLPLDADGAPTCTIFEVGAPDAIEDCAVPGREEVTPSLRSTLERALASDGWCGEGSSQTPCGELTLCTLLPAAGSDADACLNDPMATGEGYCYLDAMQDLDGDGVLSCTVSNPQADCVGNPELLASCPDTARRALRFLSDGDTATPRAGAHLYLGCAAETR